MDNETMKQIESAQNPEVKALVKLRKRRDRDQSGLFLIEGYRELLRAVENDFPIQKLYICPELFLGSNEGELIRNIRSKGTEIIQCSPKAFEKVSYRDRPDGLIGIAPQIERKLTDLEALFKEKDSPLLVVAEAIEKPGNLGTILRSSDAVGVDGVLVCDRCTDIHNPNVVRASVGTLFTVPVLESDGDETLAYLRENGVKILAATPDGDTLYTETDLTGPLAIALGTEQLGLSDKWMEQADLRVRIPMQGCADSLNVAMASTALLFEAARQRREKAKEA
ncbi:MAG: rRNA methyltransferase [Waddliaceae bacterium]|nr:rRNA methyltransferase [Waddliaceae bacterium]